MEGPFWDEEAGGLVYEQPTKLSPMEVRVIRLIQNIIKSRQSAGRPTKFRNLMGHLAQAQYTAERNWLFNQFSHKDLTGQFITLRPEFFSMDQETGDVLINKDLTVKPLPGRGTTTNTAKAMQ